MSDGGARCEVEGGTEACYSGEPSTRGVGVCVDGVRTCQAGVWSSCVGDTLPTPEQCDHGVDNDCNGLVDEECPCEPEQIRPCYLGPAATRGIGACKDGQQVCTDGRFAAECIGEVTPGPESCDAEDNDCNGATDEGCTCLDGDEVSCYSGATGTAGVGLCRAGVQLCLQGAWSAQCVGEQVPAPETCNGSDDDCNGVADEGNPGGGAACDTGLPGPCAAGVWQCAGGALSCSPTTPPSDPACQPCVGCLQGHPDCDRACQWIVASPGGVCAFPNSTDVMQCCSCYALLDCSGCLQGFPDCSAACQSIGATRGFCAVDGSHDTTNCCGCLS